MYVVYDYLGPAIRSFIGGVRYKNEFLNIWPTWTITKKNEFGQIVQKDGKDQIEECMAPYDLFYNATVGVISDQNPGFNGTENGTRHDCLYGLLGTDYVYLASQDYKGVNSAYFTLNPRVWTHSSLSQKIADYLNEHCEIKTEDMNQEYEALKEEYYRADRIYKTQVSNNVVSPEIDYYEQKLEEADEALSAFLGIDSFRQSIKDYANYMVIYDWYYARYLGDLAKWNEGFEDGGGSFGPEPAPPVKVADPETDMYRAWFETDITYTDQHVNTTSDEKLIREAWLNPGWSVDENSKTIIATTMPAMSTAEVIGWIEGGYQSVCPLLDDYDIDDEAIRGIGGDVQIDQDYYAWASGSQVYFDYNGAYYEQSAPYLCEMEHTEGWETITRELLRMKFYGAPAALLDGADELFESRTTAITPLAPVAQTRYPETLDGMSMISNVIACDPQYADYCPGTDSIWNPANVRWEKDGINEDGTT
ncbi:MAG: hypothetical protein DRP93_07350, partial [Candidatus Neomarinimicrobiota bacterium]